MLIRALFSCKRGSSRDPDGVLPHPSAYALGNVQFCHLFTLTSLHSSSPFLPYNKHNVHSHGTNSVVRLKGSSPFHLPLFYSLQTTQMFIMSSFFYTVFCLCLWHFSEKKGKKVPRKRIQYTLNFLPGELTVVRRCRGVIPVGPTGILEYRSVGIWRRI